MKVGVIADDLTGANATGVRLSKQGFRTASAVFGLVPPNEDFDAFCMDTDSRYASVQEAQRRVRETAQSLKKHGVTLFCKRVDSTFRGNVGREIDALLEVTGEETVAVVVPSFPDSGRITVGGYLLVHGTPLQRTDVAKDPIAPIRQSYVPRLLQEQSQHRVNLIELDTVLQGEQAICQALKDSVRQGYRIVVMDATTEEQVGQIAQAMAESQLPLIPVDPGPLTVAFIQTQFQSRLSGNKVLVTIGSVTPTTGRQLKWLIQEWGCQPVYVPPGDLVMGSDQREQAMQKAIDTALERSYHTSVILVTTYHPDQGLLDLATLARKQETTESSLAKSITDGLAGITRRVMEQSKGEIGGCFSSGGDVTASLFATTGAKGIELIEEIQPLVAYGRFIGGVLDGVPVVTKGGMAGDEKAIHTSVRFLRAQLLKGKTNFSKE
ncbi:four-carbon acid sugar kinase family protein [Kroppenstedtia pulmonis]|uniref:Four-carbon acid sugar kinase family protein n=1 Tax=Kroppenstedtia pulmonis TaxID=1380685 RepID=A0A7D4BK44_9BACL|nr:four-carbon acid sugar kinase family protein [Kroppenstedtia pulmonis]QKG84630.1 four-carbon acid sugar kinase family protein [Kroppenstedtia pulmonis]